MPEEGLEPRPAVLMGLRWAIWGGNPANTGDRVTLREVGSGEFGTISGLLFA
jgi:hypothetical protein